MGIQNVLNMGKIKIRFYCNECKGHNIEIRAWVDPNKEDIEFIEFVDEDDGYCWACDKTVIIKMKDNTI